MKHIILWAAVLMLAVCACHETTVGYLNVDNASYDPDTSIIRKNPIWDLDSFRMKDNSYWVTLGLQGYEGTQPIYFQLESVTSSLGEEAAAIFKEELVVKGGGVMMYPLENNARPGFYTISVRLSNAGYSRVVKDAYTFEVVE